MSTFAPTGLASMGEVPWGSHVCQFFSGSSDLRDILVPYFKAGLENNEQCLMVATAPFSADDARGALRAAVADFDTREKRGQIAIHDVRAWYGSDGINGDEIVSGLLQNEAQARADGYSGFRAHGNVGWLGRHQWSDFRDYEAGLSRALEGRRMISMCSYCLDACGSQDVLDVMSNHGLAVMKTGGWSCVEIAPREPRDQLISQPRGAATGRDRELTTLLDYLPAAFFTTDKDGRLTSFNEAAAGLWGSRPESNGTLWHDAFEMIAFDGTPVAPDQSPMSMAMSSGAQVHGIEAWVQTRDGKRTPCAFYSAPIAGKEGGIAGTINMMIDIARQKASHDHQSVLVRELHHRIKNNLATIQALAGATARNTKTVDEFQKAFMGRIGVLSKTHSLITANDSEHVPLRQLLDNELAIFEDDSGRISLSGPDVVLPAHIAVSYGMTIHELTTNALKYGALSLPRGTLEVIWRLAGSRLELQWNESNVPIPAYPSKTGFGTQLLRRLLPQQLGAVVDMTFAPDGLKAEIAIDLT